MRDYRCLDGMIANSEYMMKTAYEKGYKQGQQDNADCVSEKAREWYKNGASDMLDAVAKLVCAVNDGGYSGDEIEEIFGTPYEPEILKKFSDDPLLLIENIREYEDNKPNKTNKPTIRCVSLTYRYCLHNMNCESCDIGKAIKDAVDKAKENDND